MLAPTVLSRRLVLFAAGSLAVVTAACGGGGGTKASPSTTTTAARGARLQAFRDCMSKHGITLPQAQRRNPTGTTVAGAPDQNGPPGGGGGGGGGFGGGGGRFNQPPPGVDATTYQAALDACRSLIPTGGNTNADNPQFRTAFAAYVTCLRSHGVQITGDPAQGFQALNGVDRNSATFQAANQQCRPLLPTPSTTTTTSQ